MNMQTIVQNDIPQLNAEESAKARKKIYCALFGLMMRGTIQNLLDVCSLASVGQKYAFLETIINYSAILLFIYGLTEVLSKTGFFAISSTFFTSLLWVLNGLIFPQNVYYLKESSIQFFIYVLPFMWIGYYLIREELYLDDFLKIARIKLVLALITQIIIFIIPSADIFNNDYMNSANAMLVGLISVYYLTAVKRKPVDIVLSVAGTLVILMSGSRGVFLSLIFFWIMYVLFNKQEEKGQIVFLLGLIIAILVLLGDRILNLIVDLSHSAGFSTHLIDAIEGSSIFEDSNRTHLFRNFWSAIKQEPISGYGILGDRFISLAFAERAIYPHNIILEIWVDFGCIFGTVLIIALTVMIVKGLITQDKRISETVLVLLCACIVKLMVSSSFWNDQIFFMLLGVLLADNFYYE